MTIKHLHGDCGFCDSHTGHKAQQGDSPSAVSTACRSACGVGLAARGTALFV